MACRRCALHRESIVGTSFCRSFHRRQYLLDTGCFCSQVLLYPRTRRHRPQQRKPDAFSHQSDVDSLSATRSLEQ